MENEIVLFETKDREIRLIICLPILLSESDH